jgi:hypothetical protein
MSSSRAAFSGLNENTLPMIDAVDVGDRTFLEQRQIVGDVAEVLARRVRYRIDAVGLGAIHVAGGQAVGPHHGPCRGRGFAGDGGGGFDRVHTVLRRDAEQREDVGRFRFVVAVPVAHLGIFQHAGRIALLRVRDLLRGVHVAHVVLRSFSSAPAGLPFAALNRL